MPTRDSAKILNAVTKFAKKNLLVERKHVLDGELSVLGIRPVSPFSVHELWGSAAVDPHQDGQVRVIAGSDRKVAENEFARRERDGIRANGVDASDAA